MKLIQVSILIIVISACQQKNTIHEDQPVSLSESTTELLLDPVPEKKYETIQQYGEITNRKELYATFDKKNIVNDVVWYAEGSVKMDCSILTNPKDSNVIKFVWNTENDLGELNLAHIEIDYIIYDDNYDPIRKQKIYSDNGLYTGMNIKELETWNEGSFNFFGFDWDYGGMTLPDENSNLERSKVDVLLGLEWPENDDLAYDLVGDVEINSNDEAVKKVTIFTAKLTYYIDN